MKQFLGITLCAALLASCSLQLSQQETIDSTLPTTIAPGEMIGGWSSELSAAKGIMAASHNPTAGDAAGSVAYLRITPDGKDASFTVQGATAAGNVATEQLGTIRFEPESTNSQGGFTFLALKAQIKTAGPAGVERAATEKELKETFTKKYRYRMDGEYLRLSTETLPDDNSLTLRRIED